MIRVTIWNEHTEIGEEVLAVYPGGIHSYLARVLGTESDFEIRTAILEEPEHGLTEDVIANTDVLIWWGHNSHHLVEDAIAQRVAEAVQRGMGFIVLHSAHLAKPFRLLMGTSCNLNWRDGDYERIWTIDPTHPIAAGIPPYFELGEEEMYGERFDIPTPDELIFMGWFSGGEVFRSGCTWKRGLGKVFYFQPGHETNPSYHNEHVQRIIKNAIRWAKPVIRVEQLISPHAKSSPESLYRHPSVEVEA